MFRLILYFLLGYVIYKGYKILLNFLSNSSGKNQNDQKVHGAENSTKKINKEDIIDAQFEDIDDKEKPTDDK